MVNIPQVTPINRASLLPPTGTASSEIIFTFHSDAHKIPKRQHS
jgi:hypothetical protein